MKTTKITKIETDGEVTAVTFKLGWNQYPEDYDFSQLGDVQFLNSCEDMAMFNGTVTLKVGDSITDEKGGQPIIGAVRSEAIQKDFQIRPTVDYRDAFQDKMSGE